jgi:hypothetical protein
MELVWQWNNVRPSIAGQVDLGAFREFTNFQPNRCSNYNPKPGT